MIKLTRIIAYWMLLAIIIAYPLTLLKYGSSTQNIIYASGQLSNTTYDNNPIIDGVQCVAPEQFAFHIHTRLNISINNDSYPIPAGIGIIPDKCIYWLHTHDDSGIIHVESPIKKAFTLGQFLHIWNEFNSSDTLAQDIANNNLNGTSMVYINGILMNNNSDYRDIELKDKEQISLVVSRK
jgi:hypothetical protein